MIQTKGLYQNEVVIYENNEKQHAHPNAKRQPFIPEMVGPESISLISEHCVSNFFPFISVDGRFFTISQTDLTQEDVKCAFNPSRE